jgi:hypothetical protein
MLHLRDQTKLATLATGLRAMVLRNCQQAEKVVLPQALRFVRGKGPPPKLQIVYWSRTREFRRFGLPNWKLEQYDNYSSFTTCSKFALVPAPQHKLANGRYPDMLGLRSRTELHIRRMWPEECDPDWEMAEGGETSCKLLGFVPIAILQGRNPMQNTHQNPALCAANQFPNCILEWMPGNPNILGTKTDFQNSLACD